MTRIVVGYTKLYPEVREALEATGRSFEMIDVSANDEAYWEMIAGLWRAGEGFTLVEHDVIVRPDTFDELDNCARTWCGFPHLYVTGGAVGYFGMGCVRFRKELLLEHPDAMEKTAPISNSKHPPKHWCLIDCTLQHEVLPYLRVRTTDIRCEWGETEPLEKHLHGTVLEHLGVGVAHGCL